MTTSKIASRGLALLLVGVGIFGALGASAGPIAPAAPAMPGADSIGDPYFPLAGNGGYDVTHYDIDVTYGPNTGSLQARTTVEADATQSLSSFNLDLSGLTITSVMVDGVPAAFDRESDHELVITPSTPIGDGAAFTTVVGYHGVPLTIQDGYITVGAIKTKDGVVIYGEPEVAAFWFPSNDHPRDKATFDIHLTVPFDLQAISVGHLVSVAPTGDGWRTWSWQMEDPMATYLAPVAIGHFDINRYKVNGLRVLDAVDSDHSEKMALLSREPAIIRWLAKRFGPYPFHDLGGIVDGGGLDWALETQGRPVYPFYYLYPGSPFILVHELAHQWFGDSVSLYQWQDIWLNEGFATYAEWLWYEDKYDFSTKHLLRSWCRPDVVGARFWNVPPGDPGVEDLFDFAVYERGAMTLQALREAVGDETFFQILQTWTSAHEGSTATTADFIALSESLSGQDLEALFDAWLFQAEKPQQCNDFWADAASASGSAGAPSLPLERLGRPALPGLGLPPGALPRPLQRPETD